MLHSSPQPFGNEVLAEFIPSTILWRDNNHQTCLVPYSNYLTPWSFSFASIIQPTCKQRQIFHTASGGKTWLDKTTTSHSLHRTSSFCAVNTTRYLFHRSSHQALIARGKKERLPLSLRDGFSWTNIARKQINSTSIHYHHKSAGQFRSSCSPPGYETSLCWIKNAISINRNSDFNHASSQIWQNQESIFRSTPIQSSWLPSNGGRTLPHWKMWTISQITNIFNNQVCSSANSTWFPASSFLSTGLELSLCWRSLFKTIDIFCVLTGNALSVFVNFIQYVCYSPDPETGLWMILLASIITFHVRQFCLTSLSSLQTFDKVSSGQIFRQPSESLSTFILPGQQKKSPWWGINKDKNECPFQESWKFSVCYGRPNFVFPFTDC